MNQDFPLGHFLKLDKNAQNSSNFNDLESKTNDFEIKNGPIEPASTSDEFSKNELEDISNELIKSLKKCISTEKYNAFFKSNFLISSMDDNKICFTTTTNFVKKMIETHYYKQLEQSIFDAFGKEFSYEIQVLSGTSTNNHEIKNENSGFGKLEQYEFTRGQSVNSTSFKINNFTPHKDDLINEVSSSVIKHTNEKPAGQIIDFNKTFNNFIIGPSNNIAQAFCVSVSKSPGKVYPQLYLHGGSGLGKTHLLHAICNEIRRNNPSMRICFTTADAFFTEMVNSMKNNEMSTFKRKYTDLTDLLIIDDIHGLKNKKTTQNEFFHIFNELQNKGKQLVFTSDKPPKEIDGIEERIRTRLSSALVVEIQQPDLETRIAILKKKAIEKDIFLDDEVVNLIASCIKSNIRELEGSLIKLGAYSNLLNVDIDLEIAREQLMLTENFDDKIVNIDSVARAVTSYFKIAIGDLKGKSRIKKITKARHIAMYMTHKLVKLTLESIGEYYGNRDHTTVMYAIKTMKKKIKEDNNLSNTIYEIESSL